MPKSCFVIGPIGEAGTETRAAADDFMKYIVQHTFESDALDYSKPERADQLGEPGRITSQIIRLLMEADLVIADLTGNNPNVYYELSFRHALAKPVIHMAHDGTSLAFDLHDNRTIFYAMHARRVEEARAELKKQLHRIHDPEYRPTNPITETADLVKLERNGSTEAQLLAQVIRSVEGLDAQVRELRVSVSTALGHYGPDARDNILSNLLAGLGAVAAESHVSSPGPTIVGRDGSKKLKPQGPTTGKPT